jgi:hypothetical protein
MLWIARSIELSPAKVPNLQINTPSLFQITASAARRFAASRSPNTVYRCCFKRRSVLSSISTPWSTPGLGHHRGTSWREFTCPICLHSAPFKALENERGGVELSGPTTPRSQLSFWTQVHASTPLINLRVGSLSRRSPFEPAASHSRRSRSECARFFRLMRRWPISVQFSAYWPPAIKVSSTFTHGDAKFNSEDPAFFYRFRHATSRCVANDQ